KSRRASHPSRERRSRRPCSCPGTTARRFRTCRRVRAGSPESCRPAKFAENRRDTPGWRPAGGSSCQRGCPRREEAAIACPKAKGVIVLDAHRPDPHENIPNRHEFHAQAVFPRLSAVRPEPGGEIDSKKGLLARFHLAGERHVLEARQPQFIVDLAGFEIIE